MRALAAAPSDHAGSPSTVTVPASGRTSPRAHLMSVVLPAPFLPSRPRTDPTGTATSTALRTSFEPYRLVRPAAWTAGAGAPWSGTSCASAAGGRSVVLAIVLLQQGFQFGDHLIRRERQVAGGVGHLAEQRQQRLPPRLAVGGRPRRFDPHPLAADELDDAVPLQQRVRLGDGHGVDLKVFGHLAD